MNAKSIRLVDSLHLHRPRTRSATQRRWPVFAPLLIAVGLLMLPAFVLPTRADHVQPIEGSDPAAVVAAYVAAVNARDLEGILALYTDDAVHVALPTPDGSAGVCRGKEQFRMFYEQGVANGDQIEMVDGTLAVADDRVSFLSRLASDPWRELGVETLEATTEAVVVDGQITTHVVMLTPASVRELLAALGTIPASSPQEPFSHGVHLGNAR
ncbi:MAG: nuclear transport factor 2 family protein [Rhizobiales bacterium]|nr:nuclear transport factor 2 family protein [Hyphomicrobiales bacterium]